MIIEDVFNDEDCSITTGLIKEGLLQYESSQRGKETVYKILVVQVYQVIKS